MSPDRSCQTQRGRPGRDVTVAAYVRAPWTRQSCARPPPRGRHDRRRPARPDDAPGRDRAGPVAAGARRRARRPRRAGLRRTCGRGPPTDLAALRAFARGCAAVTFDHEQVPQDEPARAGRRRGRRAPAPGRAAARPGQARDAARGWPRSGLPVPRVRRGRRRRPTSSGSAPSTAGRWCSRPSAAATTGAACGCSTGPTPELVAELLAAGTPLMVEEAVPMRRELAALVARSPFGQAAAWPVVETVQARRPVRRRCSPRRPGLDRGRGRGGPASSRCGSPPSWGSRGCSPSSCSRPTAPRRAWWSTSWRCARTTPGTGRSRAPARRSSSSTCGRCSTTRSGATAPTAPAVVMANVLGAAPSAPAMTRRRAAAPPVRPVPGRQGAPVRQGASGRPARSGT